ncbi:peptidylprolyl isomerase [Pseudokordiimonas caeni]|uniref:peptidylprolyl isomerase n=1 Tax=Pseudokordiimonas caeni TaxID=2997908 RepID=UPI002811957D|nr:peptidylprolyl isomerase [Pseudokordiimonas caeni]
MGKLLREPLLHFLLAGGLLYGLYATVAPEKGEEPGVIIADREALIAFMEYRAKIFDPETFALQYDALSPAFRQKLADDYVDEEILYRTAKGLGLENGDYVIRQRLIQKQRFLIEDVTEAVPSEAALAAYHAANAARYAVPGSITFAHVFFDVEARGDEAAQAAAKETLTLLNGRRAGFEAATGAGDRFPWLTNYVERTPDFVADHFGSEMMTSLFTIDPDAGVWQGPLRSSLGYHLVFVSSRTEPRIPSFKEVEAHVKADYEDEARRANERKALDKLRESYEIRLDLGTSPAE